MKSIFLTKAQIATTTPKIQRAVTTTAEVRAYLLNSGRFGTNLACACTHSATLKCALLDDFSLFRGGMFYHKRPCHKSLRHCNGHPHYWIEVDDVVIDGTATQFGPYPAVAVVPTTAAVYAQKRAQAPRFTVKQVAKIYLAKAEPLTTLSHGDRVLQRMRDLVSR